MLRITKNPRFYHKSNITRSDNKNNFLDKNYKKNNSCFEKNDIKPIIFNKYTFINFCKQKTEDECTIFFYKNQNIDFQIIDDNSYTCFHYLIIKKYTNLINSILKCYPISNKLIDELISFLLIEATTEQNIKYFYDMCYILLSKKTNIKILDLKNYLIFEDECPQEYIINILSLLDASQLNECLEYCINNKLNICEKIVSCDNFDFNSSFYTNILNGKIIDEIKLCAAASLKSSIIILFKKMIDKITTNTENIHLILYKIYLIFFIKLNYDYQFYDSILNICGENIDINQFMLLSFYYRLNCLKDFFILNQKFINENINFIDNNGNTYLHLSLIFKMFNISSIILNISHFKYIYSVNNVGENIISICPPNLKHKLISLCSSKENIEIDNKSDSIFHFNEFNFDIKNNINCSGTYGLTRYAYHKNSNKLYAIKTYFACKWDLINFDFIKDVFYMENCHGIISDVLGVVMSPLTYNLFQFSSYFSYLNNYDRICVYKKIFHKMMIELYKIHSRGIIHEDLTEYNIMIDQCGNVKIIDFGISKYVGLCPQVENVSCLNTVEKIKSPDSQEKIFIINNTEVKILYPRKSYTSDIFSIAISFLNVVTCLNSNIIYNKGYFYKLSHQKDTYQKINTHVFYHDLFSSKINNTDYDHDFISIFSAMVDISFNSNTRVTSKEIVDFLEQDDILNIYDFIKYKRVDIKDEESYEKNIFEKDSLEWYIFNKYDNVQFLYGENLLMEEIFSHHKKDIITFYDFHSNDKIILEEFFQLMCNFSLSIDVILNSFLSLNLFKEYINNKEDILNIIKIGTYIYSSYFDSKESESIIQDIEEIDKFNTIIKDKIFLYKNNTCHIMTIISYYIKSHNYKDITYNIELKAATIKFLLKLIINVNCGTYLLHEVIETILFYITNDISFKHNKEILNLLNVL